MKYLVLIGDMLGSRQLTDRRETQERFKSACRSINRRRKHYGVVSPLMVTLGDEFQGVLGSADRLWPLIARLELDMHPQQFRFSVGLGEITTAINSRSSLGMDGPAFHNAREGIETLRDEGGYYGISGLHNHQRLVQCSLDLWSAARSKWNYNRLATFVRLLEGASVPVIARELELSEQAVYRTRRDGDLETVIAMLSEINGLVEEELQG